MMAMPDSGADRSCFPEEWAAVLGFDLKACQERKVKTGNGIGSHFESSEPLRATVCGLETELCACFGPIEIGLLGREDFFRYFHVSIDERRKVTVLRRYLTPPTKRKG